MAQACFNEKTQGEKVCDLLSNNKLLEAITTTLDHRACVTKDVKVRLLEMLVEQEKIEIFIIAPLGQKIPAPIKDMHVKTIENFLQIITLDFQKKQSYTIVPITKKGH
jgi:hypothetical protein